MLYQLTNYNKKMTPEAERFNGWAAMLGFVAAVGAYVTTGQIIPGIFQYQITVFINSLFKLYYFCFLEKNLDFILNLKIRKTK